MPPPNDGLVEVLGDGGVSIEVIQDGIFYAPLCATQVHCVIEELIHGESEYIPYEPQVVVSLGLLILNFFCCLRPLVCY